MYHIDVDEEIHMSCICLYIYLNDSESHLLLWQSNGILKKISPTIAGESG